MSDDRYSRQTLFMPIGEKGQKKLAEKHVLIIGLGALGSGSAEILARSGVGELTIVDRDYIEWSNLQRQQLYTEEDAKKRLPKAVAAKRHLEKINSEITINAHVLDVTPEEMEQLIDGVDLLLDATDNFDIRMIINDISQKYKIPWIYGSIVGSYGITYTIIPEEKPCLYCVMNGVPSGGQTCDTVGVISPVVGMVIMYQTVEALKYLTENFSDMRKEVLSFDLWTNEQSKINVDRLKKLDCPSCGTDPTYPFLQYDNQLKSAVLCGRDSVQIRPPKKETRDLQALATALGKTAGKVELNPFLLSYSIGKERLVLFADGRAIIHGTKDIEYARTLYHRYFG
ncbi:MAG TPA: thiazole biosynthesis adenylyltransferase ThiF [Bacillota bacterium]|nr:thiazole biosynthesis adenylyltransferase ThiF [Bacillota bacterium]